MYHNWKYSFHIGTSPLSVSTAVCENVRKSCQDRENRGKLSLVHVTNENPTGDELGGTTGLAGQGIARPA